MWEYAYKQIFFSLPLAFCCEIFEMSGYFLILEYCGIQTEHID